MSRFAALVVVLLLLAGCGFHLQGAYTLPPEMASTYISTTDRYSPFYRELSAQLEAAGVSLATTAATATAVLTVMAEETGQRVLSVSARNVPTEYEVFYTVEYSLASEEQVLMSPRTLNLTRDYRYDENLVLGKAAEEQQLRKAIVADLVRVLIKQIDTL